MTGLGRGAPGLLGDGSREDCTRSCLHIPSPPPTVGGLGSPLIASVCCLSFQHPKHVMGSGRLGSKDMNFHFGGVDAIGPQY